MNIKKFRKKYSSWIIVIFLITLSVAIAFMSPLCPFGNGVSAIDSSIFRYIGILMKDGFVPYKDTFDHKGIFLYFIQFIGAFISERYGVWAIELLFIAVTVFISYKIARDYCERVFSVIVLLVVYALLYSFYEGGNLVEVYAMPFILIGIYIFRDYFTKDIINWKRLVICGAVCAAIFLLRPNMISTWVVFPLMVLIRCIKRREFSRIIHFLLFFLIGFLAFCFPAVVYLVAHNAFEDFIYCYFQFNFAYIALNSSTVSSKIEAVKYFVSYFQVYVAFVIMGLMILKNKAERFFNIGYLIYMATSVIFISFSGVTYGHYGMTLLPMLIYPYSIAFGEVNIRMILEHKLLLAIIIYVTVFMFGVNPLYIIQNGKAIAITSRSISSTEMVSEYIKNNSNKDDMIIVHGNEDIIYILSDRKAASRFSYQAPVVDIDIENMNEYLEDLTENLPLFIVIKSNSDFRVNEINEFIEKNNYILDKQIELYNIYRYSQDIV